MFKKKILIVSDAENTIKLISGALIPAGYEVLSALSGMEGLDRVKKEKPDLVLLSDRMHEMDGFEVCKQLRDQESNNLMPIIMLSTSGEEESKLKGLELGADDYVQIPFNSRELVARVRNTILRIERNRKVSPLTGLQGNMEILSEINRRIAGEEIFSVIYADVDNFKAFNDVYGFANGDRVIKLTADIIGDSVRGFGSPNDYIGHIGGDDFMVITEPGFAEPICDNIVKIFNEKILSFYTQEDRASGFITTSNRQGQVVKHSIMAISLAIVSNEFRNFTNHIQIVEIAVELKKKAKTIMGSVYFKDRRKS